MSKREMTDSLERPGNLKELKIVLVGPAKCGKTALVQRFVNNTFSDNYVPTGFEKYSTKGKVGEYSVDYSIWDTSGSGSYDTVRPLAYQDAQVFILCFSIGDPDSLSLTTTKWLPEIQSHSPTIPIILCGCKADTRPTLAASHVGDTLFSRTSEAAMSREQGTIACQQINAAGYVETSSRQPSPGIPEIFEMAATIGLGISALPPPHPSSKTIMKKRKTCSSNMMGTSKSASGSSATMSPNSKSKPQIKSDIRKNAKNCSVM